MTQRIIYWFRNDLRLKDNEGFYSAVKNSEEVIPVYVFDPRHFASTRFGFRRAGAMRAQFLIECVSELREQIRKKGGELLIRVGEPEKIIAQLAEDFSAEYVYTSKEIAPDETRVESSLSKNLKVGNIDIKLFWMNTLMDIGNLPFTISKLPKTFDAFYGEVVSHFSLSQQVPAPEHIRVPVDYTAGVLPSLPMLGIDPKELPNHPGATNTPHANDNTAALECLNEFVQESKQPDASCTTEDLLMEHGLSRWLSIGGLSPRLILSSMKGHPLADIVRDALLKRDYFHWTLLRYGPRLFKPSGISHNLSHIWRKDLAEFEKWQKGLTENPQVNALVEKLNQTGYLTFEERVTAANFLANEMNLNWTWGAAYFESQLIDYNVSNSWCNWNYVAGVAGEMISAES